MKKEIRIIALDMDGTLLDSQKRISLRNEAALRRCLESGVHIVPTTGRTWDGVPEELCALPGVRYAITTNGAIVLDTQEHKIIRERKLSNKLALELLELAESFHAMYDPYINGRGYTESRFIEHMEEYGLSKLIQSLVKKTRNVVTDIHRYVKESGLPVEKINFFFNDMEEREKARGILAKRGDIVLSSSLENNLEINALGATKGDGLLALADYLGFEHSQTMACGDGENDFSMIRQAGIGVVMANGEEKLKEIADFVTLSNDEDGVAAAIQRFVFHNQKQV